ncbi:MULTISPECIES: hypothetical protein [Commensalibacter]|uniref:Uncharacterized protein n=2 Tax=Commensalibacter TaxID=1079922 RepID=W7DW11_9PROT|nr:MULTISPECIES: hypothetical protein [Commensalibacter]EUK18408.1 hypothetical protein COMX_01630 [Commensalibacter papalotli (ex Servin-Garciduenas et al. 2014)]CAI3934210.1 unnamed protein product [Commensalibacter papalotli (ex Botero et al. 2024)]CAI3941499.1 unnamed protein product [Commensalibacter papalotli (ex Botero et al. 2024)]
MKNLLLSFTLGAGCLISHQTYAQNLDGNTLYVDAVINLQQSMPRKATIDGKRIYSVDSDHICSITVTMGSSRQYQFSLVTWPEKGHIDDAGYSEFILKDTDNKPHILRTDKIKGKRFLASMKNLITNCQKSTQKNKFNDS